MAHSLETGNTPFGDTGETKQTSSTLPQYGEIFNCDGETLDINFIPCTDYFDPEEKITGGQKMTLEQEDVRG